MHVLLLFLLAWTAHAQTAPRTPTGFSLRVGEQDVIVRWETVPNVLGYRVYRKAPWESDFRMITPATIRPIAYVDTVSAGHRYQYFVRSVSLTGGIQSIPTDTITTPAIGPLSDDDFLELVSRTAFDFLWNEANPANGMVRDRSRENSAASVASIGMALTGYGVAADRGWITRDQARERTRTTLNFLWNAPQSTAPDATGYKGHFYHFLNMQTGRRAGTNELSTIDTALLMAGVLYAAAYFDQDHPDEAFIRDTGKALYDRVDWAWASPRAPRISHGWNPESGFIPYDYGGYSEAMILYLLALGSTTYPVERQAWEYWMSGYRWQSDFLPGRPYVAFAPLFGHQYSHIWVDFRGRRDAAMRDRGIDYFENSRRATLAQVNYAAANPNRFAGYSANEWGITASDTPTGYRARGAPPAYNDDGTLNPTAPGGSYPFTPEESLRALRTMYTTYGRRLWGIYGFRDAYNPTQNWFATDYIGIDQGPILLMIENYRSGSIWQRFMTRPEIQQGLTRAGFQTLTSSESTPEPRSWYIAPHPAQQNTHFRQLPAMSRVRIVNLLGQTVANLEAESGGDVLVEGLAPGTYIAEVRSGTQVSNQLFLVVP